MIQLFASTYIDSIWCPLLLCCAMLIHPANAFSVTTPPAATGGAVCTGPSYPSTSTLCMTASSSSAFSSFSSLVQSSSTSSSSVVATLTTQLASLRQTATPFFDCYNVDILASCEYLPQELFECYTESCEIYPVDEQEIPPDIVRRDQQEAEFILDGWTRWDMPTEDYFDTTVFPEDYTGYDGAEVWRYIHKNIAFDDNPSSQQQQQQHWKADFNKAVSGLHSMVSAQVIRGIQEKVDSGEAFSAQEKWRDPKMEFARRLGPTGETPLAMENLYFSFMLVLSAVAQCANVYTHECQSGGPLESASAELQAVLSNPLFQEEAVTAVATRIQGNIAAERRENLWELRMRCRELLRIMNCVQCNKCRLHGKISVLGVITAIRVLSDSTTEGGSPLRLKRVELAALMVALDKFSTSVRYCATLSTDGS